MSTTALTLNDVSMIYPDGDSEIKALDSVSMEVAAGEFVAVTGPSGSGKSTLLAVAGLLQQPTRGTIEIGGVDVGSLRAKDRTTVRRDEIGFVFQQSNLIGSLTALEQLQIVAHLRGEKPSDATDRAKEILDRVGLRDAAGRRPHQLSGGQRQRVGIARALMNTPTLLLVDEPTSALDKERGAAILDLLGEVTHERGVATVMVTHDVEHLGSVDRVFGMDDGVLTVHDTDRGLQPA
ncbi:putative ABC transport system ATP-binding protein [Antricoccus suffuscus]|uniref:Putative ABC transport system ATP-binding protein n=1 Tax=Antricoccus suffuscus TaxID=1629062 RepID=A0A2T0ZZ06_9ACTN|nr:ABC transporter ATP-binding protein [Antricoccus suffuscus]PRZ41585.1 putative ABC transport system ATP-binding protein [Antricoccus suffuscus]